MNTFVDWIYCSIGFYCTVRKGFANSRKNCMFITSVSKFFSFVSP